MNKHWSLRLVGFDSYPFRKDERSCYYGFVLERQNEYFFAYVKESSFLKGYGFEDISAQKLRLLSHSLGRFLTIKPIQTDEAVIFRDVFITTFFNARYHQFSESSHWADDSPTILDIQDYCYYIGEVLLSVKNSA